MADLSYSQSAQPVAIVEEATGNAVSVTAAGGIKVDGSGTALPITGDVANGVADSGNPIKNGGRAATALPTAVADGQRVNCMRDTFGRQVTVGGTVRNLRSSVTFNMAAGTGAQTVLAAGGTGIFTDLVGIIIANTTNNTSNRVTLSDGTLSYNFQSPNNSTVGISLPGQSIAASTVNTAWSATNASSNTGIWITLIYEKNK